MIYKFRELDSLIKRYNQRITDNFAQSYDNRLKINSINRYIDNKAESVLHDEDSLKALQDRVKQLSDRINNQLELINDNDDDINNKIKTHWHEIRDIKNRLRTEERQNNSTNRIDSIEDCLNKNIKIDTKADDLRRDQHEILLKAMKALETKVKALEDKLIRETVLISDKVIDNQDKADAYTKRIINKVNDLPLSNKKAIRAIAEKLEIDTSRAYVGLVMEDE